MKLLFDQNLSRHLVRLLADLYPVSLHVFALGLDQATDTEIWSYARGHELLIISRDADFPERSAVYGHPPQSGVDQARQLQDL